MRPPPLTSDVTAQIELWDAGSEADEYPGAGPNQAPRQSGGNTGGPDPDNTVQLVSDGFSYPAVNAILRVTVTAQ